MRLVDRANEHARDIAPKLRDLLAEPSFVAGLERFGHALSGQELIHTSYFDHPPILDLLALHVAWGRQDQLWLRRASRVPEDLWNWFCEFKRSVQEGTALQKSHRRMPGSPLIRPRRRAIQHPCATDQTPVQVRAAGIQASSGEVVRQGM